MTKKKRSILMSVMTLMLCLAMVAGGTYALFTDSVRLTTHLQAGNLDITLHRTKLESKILDERTGFLEDYTNGNIIDFSNVDPFHPNVFDIEQGDLIVPGSTYKSTLRIQNNSNNSKVAFGYWVEIVLHGADPELAKQLQIKVMTDDGKYIEHRLNTGSTLGSEQYPIAILAIGQEDYFDVSVTFVDDRVDNSITNNNAMNQNVYFDVVVHAVQVTENPAQIPTP